MGDCCCPDSDTPYGAMCPVTGTPGKRVERGTVKALLVETSLRRLSDTRHFFCAEPDCDVVYFDDAGAVYRIADLRVPVWQKQPVGARMVCYCFGENESDMRTEIEATGDSRAVQRVREHIGAGRCACEIRNPHGVCCLGDVTAAVERVRRAAREGASKR
ncbi:MAG: putative iron-sulfur cluster-binding metallochaperone [Vicinamibacterales bacterium]